METLYYKPELKLEVIRKHLSYDYKYKEIEGNYLNNTKNNSLDIIRLVKNDTLILFEAKAQTVSNHPHMNHRDTIKEGTFQVKCFVQNFSFEGNRIHGLINALDLDGQAIDQYSMQKIGNGEAIGRWLIHDRFYAKTGKETNYAYSGGCFIMSVKDLSRFNAILKKNGIEDFVKDGEDKHYVLNGILKEV